MQAHTGLMQPSLWITKEKTWGSAYAINESDGFDLHVWYWFKYRINYNLFQTNITCTLKRSFADFVISRRSNNVWKLVDAGKQFV